MFWGKLCGQKACATATISLEKIVIYSVLAFWSKSFGKKALTSVAAWVENTVIYSVLEQVAWQEGLSHCFHMGRKRCNLQCFVLICFAKRLLQLLQYRLKTL